jgi:hypothetical protein
MVTRTFKVYGRDGHRQAESFRASYVLNFSNEKDGNRIIEVMNADATGTNEYSVLRITRDTSAECEQELFGQLSDGIFENHYTGIVEEINA